MSGHHISEFMAQPSKRLGMPHCLTGLEDQAIASRDRSRSRMMSPTARVGVIGSLG